MKDLALEILNSPNKEVEYWSFVFEHYSLLNDLHDYPPELIKITLKPILKNSLIQDISSFKNYSIDSSYFNFRSVKTDSLTHARTSGAGQIFLYPNKESCIKAYNNAVYETLLQAKREQERINHMINQRFDRLERSFIDSDIIMETFKRSQ